jgi:DinB superfamily
MCAVTSDHPPHALPDDLAGLLRAFDEVEREADGLVASLDDEQLNWTPARGRWSIAQCLDHLNLTNAAYLRSLGRACERARAAGLTRTGPLALTPPARWLVALVEPPPRFRLPAPPVARPAARKLKAEVWPEFVRTNGHVKALVLANAGLDFNRVRMPFPVLRRLRASTALSIMAAHERRHLRQAREVRESPGFPRS